MTKYVCPVCDKALVTDDEPPGIIHKCDDCAVLMKPAENDALRTVSGSDSDE